MALIPKGLLFPAPGLPKGNVLLGYNEKGHCPMFIDNTCSIYEQRPDTCRAYDCRIFPATGLLPGDDKPLIAEQVRRWQFDFSNEQGRTHSAALKKAAKFLREYAAFFPNGFVPGNSTQQAMLVLKVYEVFLKAPAVFTEDEDGVQIQKIVKAVILAYKQDESKNEI